MILPVRKKKLREKLLKKQKIEARAKSIGAITDSKINFALCQLIDQSIKMHENILAATKEMHSYNPNLGDVYKMMAHPKQKGINRVALANFLKRYYPELA